MGTITVLVILLIVRIVHVYTFFKHVSKMCKTYDWKYINEHGDPLLDVLADEDTYYIKAEWSAYNFLFLKGPHPLEVFFSLKSLTIPKQYSKEAVEKLNRYELV